MILALMDELVRLVHAAIPNSFSHSDSFIKAKLLEIPIRGVLVLGLVWYLRRQSPGNRPVDAGRLYLLQIIMAVLTAYYTLDLTHYLSGLYAFYAPEGGLCFDRFLVGAYIQEGQVWGISAVVVLSALASIRYPGLGALWIIQFFGLAALEGTVYSYGYSENTFTSFRIVQWFLFLHVGFKNDRVVRYGQIALLLCYAIPGVEKVLSFSFGILNEDVLKNYAAFFHLSPGQFRPVYGAGLALQVLMLVPIRQERLRRWAPAGLIFFHLGTALMGVGGITSPWISAILILLL